MLRFKHLSQFSTNLNRGSRLVSIGSTSIAYRTPAPFELSCLGMPSQSELLLVCCSSRNPTCAQARFGVESRRPNHLSPRRKRLGKHPREKSPVDPTGEPGIPSARRTGTSAYLELRADYHTNLVTVHRTRRNLRLSSEKRLSKANWTGAMIAFGTREPQSLNAANLYPPAGDARGGAPLGLLGRPRPSAPGSPGSGNS